MKKRKLIAIAGMVLVMGSVLPVSAAESLADFDYQTYADTYPDLKAAFGYNAAALYNHYETNGKAEGRVAIFTDGASSATTVESLATFDYKAYADTYPDLKAAFGYDAASLYNHYVNSGKAEGRVAVFTAAATAQPAQTATTTKTTVSEKLDPLPPLNPSKMPDWFDARTLVESMTNAQLDLWLADFKKAGIESFLIYGRTGCEIEYMSENWMDVCDFLVRRAGDLDMDVYLYDEFD